MIPQLTITLPPSKSLYNRLFVMARLARLEIPPQWSEWRLCEDLTVMRQACSSSETTISVGASGTAMRLVTALWALICERELLLVSPIQRMTQRPIAQLIELLNQLGGSVSLPASQAPIGDCYPLVHIRPSEWHHKTMPTLHLPDDLASSQIVSALLLIAPYLPCGLSLRWRVREQLPSASYIQLTTALIEQCGIAVTTTSHSITVAPGEYDKRLLTHLLTHPIGDWSSAQYPLQWALMAPRPCQIQLTNLPLDSLQPDARALELLQIPSALIMLDKQTLCFDSQLLQRHLRRVSSDTISLSDNPDFAPTLIALHLFYQKRSHLLDLDHLRLKESDRIALILQNADRLGYSLSYSSAEGFHLAGSEPTDTREPVQILTARDHRMVMTWAPFAWYRKLQIGDPESVAKSYPTFWQDLRKLCEVIATPLHI